MTNETILIKLVEKYTAVFLKQPMKLLARTLDYGIKRATYKQGVL